MKLHKLRISNFQSFGSIVTEISLENLTFLIGPNGSGKTALLQALCRLFAFDPNLRRILPSDFHVPLDETPDSIPNERTFWIDVEFSFPELGEEGDHSTIPPNFAHMRIDDGTTLPRVRFRLEATLYSDGEIEESLDYILDVDVNDEPINRHPVPRSERNNIHFHYLPARRNPTNHISYTANSLLGRVLRAANWEAAHEEIEVLTNSISEILSANEAISSLDTFLIESWQKLHSGSFFTSPRVTFNNSEIESLLRHLSITFNPGHDTPDVDFSRLSDGQQSMLYLSLVIAIHNIGRSVLSGENTSFNIEKLRPPIFTLIAMEEPENSLSPHYLGRIVKMLKTIADNTDAQALITTHSPSMLKRVSPKSIRYMRLDETHQTQISTITMPSTEVEAYKYVKEAIEAFPELYFSKLVVLGEGDSEEIVLPRLFNAKGLEADEASIAIVPLGGRHVNHFWRLLSDLNIPYVTLLDLDLARYGGGWGRIKYICRKLLEFKPSCGITQAYIDNLPAWNDSTKPLLNVSNLSWITFLEGENIFFSSPLDLDFSMLKSFPSAYMTKAIDKKTPSISTLKIVLSKNFSGEDQYTRDETKLFITYRKRFKSSSKPASHLSALSKLEDADLLATIPPSIERLIDKATEILSGIPE